MKITNTKNTYGLVAILLHWLMALMIIILFIMGKYMVDLNYYDPLYHKIPWVHKSIGVIIFWLLIFRYLWKTINPKVTPLSHYKKWEVVLAQLIHKAFYLLIAITCISGYLISTSKGSGIEVFNFIEIPALITLAPKGVDLISEVHETASLLIMIFFGIHFMGALKHHFIDKDKTIKRITRGA